MADKVDLGKLRWTVSVVPDFPYLVQISAPGRPALWRRVLQWIVLGWRWVPYKEPPRDPFWEKVNG